MKMYKIYDRILYERTHSGIWVNKYKKTDVKDVKDVKIERINLKNKAYFLRKAYKNGGSGKM